jgi:hypothetical protein
MPVHFDVEIKKGSGGGNYGPLLGAHISGLGIQSDPRPAKVEALGAAYSRVVGSDLQESECKEGLRIVKTHILSILKRILGQEDSPSLSVLTGCRPGKFSLHIIIADVYCDSAVLTMPLLAFEIARTFVFENTEWLLENEGGWDTPEGRFRVRAMMLEGAAGKAARTPPPRTTARTQPRREAERWIFKGYDNSPIDEAIYSANHLLRAPGPSTALNIGALAPVRHGSPLLVRERQFYKLFPLSDDGYKDWVSYLITRTRGGVTLEETRSVLTGWRPSQSYPVGRRWYAEYRKRSAVFGSLEPHFDRVVAFRADLFLLYEERRLTRHERRRLTPHEHSMADSDLDNAVSAFLGRFRVKKFG